METVHRSVLLKETIDGLNLDSNKDSVVVDATFGGGGHSLYILENFPKVKVMALDQDKGAWERSKHKFTKFQERIKFLNINFRDLGVEPQEFGGSTPVDGIIFDLGLSSDQLENAERGFSFLRDEALLMTMKENPDESDITAYDIVNTWSEESLADIIYGYGEERLARRIAKGIVTERVKKEIKTTFELVEVIRNSIPVKLTHGKIHFATKTFQALRMAVNDELNVLKSGLENGFKSLKQAGRMSVISFHSLEDRIVKNFYKEKKVNEQAILINKKPITPSQSELKENKRSRSAKLRVLEKLKD